MCSLFHGQTVYKKKQLIVKKLYLSFLVRQSHVALISKCRSERQCLSPGDEAKSRICSMKCDEKTCLLRSQSGNEENKRLYRSKNEDEKVSIWIMGFTRDHNVSVDMPSNSRVDGFYRLSIRIYISVKFNFDVTLKEFIRQVTPKVSKIIARFL